MIVNGWRSIVHFFASLPNLFLFIIPGNVEWKKFQHAVYQFFLFGK